MDGLIFLVIVGGAIALFIWRKKRKEAITAQERAAQWNKIREIEEHLSGIDKSLEVLVTKDTAHDDK